MPKNSNRKALWKWDTFQLTWGTNSSDIGILYINAGTQNANHAQATVIGITKLESYFEHEWRYEYANTILQYNFSGFKILEIHPLKPLLRNFINAFVLVEWGMPLAMLGLVSSQLCSQVYATYLKIRHLQIYSADAWSSNELQWLNLMIGHQDSCSNKNYQGNMPYSFRHSHIMSLNDINHYCMLITYPPAVYFWWY